MIEQRQAELIRVHAGIAVDKLAAALTPAMYAEITARQDHPGSAHADTEAVFLRWAAGQDVESVFTDLEAVDYPAWRELEELVSPILAGLTLFVGALEVGRVMIAKLKAGGSIDYHVDEGAYADRFERFHVVLEADPGNMFFVESAPCVGEYATMRAGECWWFNHKRPHWVENMSSRPRVHLIVDAISPAYRRERGE